jgi:predicted HicB family RNase H-like nuclease
MVRLPRSLHTAIRDAAWRQRKSMNQLCVELLREPLQDVLRAKDQ